MKTREIKVEWCENWIIALFNKHLAPHATGIEVNLFWSNAEKAGLWIRGTYGSPMSKALANLTECKVINDDCGNYLFSVFRLK